MSFAIHLAILVYKYKLRHVTAASYKVQQAAAIVVLRVMVGGGGGGGGRLLLCFVVCAGLMVAGGDAATSVIVGMAQCASCTRKSMTAEAAFKGLKVAIKCSGGAGEYESKFVGDLDDTGAFAVALPADVDLRGGSAQCFAQLHSAASSAPCPGQEPSSIVRLNESESEGTFVAVAGKKTTGVVSTTPECAAANICFPCGVFGRKPFYMHRRMRPLPEYGMPMPVYDQPGYGTPAPRCLCTPTPEPGCQCPYATPVYGTPMPEYDPTPTPEYGTPTPVYGTPAPRCLCSPTPEPGCQCPTAAPTPVYGTPAPRCMCSPTMEAGCQCPTAAPTPVYGTPMAQPPPPPPLPVYGTPAPRCLCTPTPAPGCQCPSPTPTPVYGTPATYPPATPVYGPPASAYGAAPTPGCPPAAPEYGMPPAHH